MLYRHFDKELMNTLPLNSKKLSKSRRKAEEV